MSAGAKGSIVSGFEGGAGKSPSEVLVCCTVTCSKFNMITDDHVCPDCTCATLRHTCIGDGAGKCVCKHGEHSPEAEKILVAISNGTYGNGDFDIDDTHESDTPPGTDQCTTCNGYRDATNFQVRCDCTEPAYRCMSTECDSYLSISSNHQCINCGRFKKKLGILMKESQEFLDKETQREYDEVVAKRRKQDQQDQEHNHVVEVGMSYGRNTGSGTVKQIREKYLVTRKPNGDFVFNQVSLASQSPFRIHICEQVFTDLVNAVITRRLGGFK